MLTLTPTAVIKTPSISICISIGEESSLSVIILIVVIPEPVGNLHFVFSQILVMNCAKLTCCIAIVPDYIRYRDNTDGENG